MSSRPPVRFEVDDQFVPATPPAFLVRVVTATLDHLSRSDLAVSLLLTDDAGIARIHGEFMDDPTPTDVISFPMGDSVELVVNVERARCEAAERGHDAMAELALYIVHGILHACGFDDIESADRLRMRDAELAVLGRLELRVAPVDDD